MTKFISLTEARKHMNTRHIHSLIEKAQNIAKEFRQKETELISALQELDSSKAYRATGYNSLFQFCVESLELTEHQAYQYITVSRKCTEVPELMVALEDRRITVSKARKLSSVISAENQQPWIDLACNHSQKDLEKAVRSQCPLPPVKDHLQILSKTEVKIQATIDSETAKMLERVMDLVSGKIPRGEKNSINRSMKVICKEYLKKNDPVEKAKRALQKKTRVTNGNTYRLAKTGSKDAVSYPALKREYNEHKKATKYANKRTPFPAKIRHQVIFRDRGQCRFHKNDKRCENKKFLEIHHRTPVSQSGADTLENLILLCREHHKAVHSSFAIQNHGPSTRRKPS